MKIYLNKKFVPGPWGGGTKFIQFLENKIISSGHEVSYNINDQDIDVLFCFDPRPNEICQGGYNDLLRYRFIHKNRKFVPIIQRVGDVGTHGKPDLTTLVKQSVNLSDYLIFPSEWSKKYIEYMKDNFSIIINAPHPKYFKSLQEKNEIEKPIKVVTHHWSTNEKKGFEFYEEIDQLKNVEFTYIGRSPKDFHVSKKLDPMGLDQLKETLPKYDVYVTASEQEAGANHVLEALACRLPILYKDNGGSINEYCEKYGEEFWSIESFSSKLDMIINNYSLYKEKVMKYDRSIEDVVSKYLEIIERFDV